MLIQFGNVKLHVKEVPETIEIKQNLNEAIDGSTYGYYFGQVRTWNVTTTFFDEETKKKIENNIKDKHRLYLDDGKFYNVRIDGEINYNVFKTVQGEKTYTAQFTLREVVV